MRIEGVRTAMAVAIVVMVGLTGYLPAVSAAQDEAVEAFDLSTEFPIPAQDLLRGAELYDVRCALCHGRSGRGDGPVAANLDPLPRDFTPGIFKIRSSPDGATDYDIFRTITRGIPGTAMPPWGGLPRADRWQLVHYIRSFATAPARQEDIQPVAIPPEPSFTQESVAMGRNIYIKRSLAMGEDLYVLAGCNDCHGIDGRGNGPRSRDLKDDWGNPIYPFDYTRSWKMKGGREGEDIFRTIQAGIGGTPMPSYAEAISPEQTWHVVHFIQSLFQDVVP